LQQLRVQRGLRVVSGGVIAGLGGVGGVVGGALVKITSEKYQWIDKIAVYR